MKQLFIFIIILLLFGSCATILNRPATAIYVTTTTPAKIVVNHDTIVTHIDKTPIATLRQSKNLNIKVFNDSINKDIIVPYKNSFAYWLNLYPGFWAGFFIDWQNPKRYTYPKRIYIDMTDTTNEYFSYDQRSKKGNFYIHLSFPYINNFMLKPDNEVDYKKSLGFFGATLGVDYYYSDKQFINFSANAAIDFFLPVPAPVDFIGYYELMSSIYLTVSNNYQIRRFLLGYGLSLTRNTWNLQYHDRFDPPPKTREPVTKTNYAVGAVFPMYYMPAERFFIGVVYRPTLFRFQNKNLLKYEHLISIDFGWKFKLNN